MTAGLDEDKPRNKKLIAARLRLPSPTGSGDPMSTQEVAEAMNDYLWGEHLKTPGSAEPTVLDHRFVSAYENGRFWWPSQHYRAAFRHVLRVTTDTELGFRRSRGRARPASDAKAPLATDRRPSETVAGRALHAGSGNGHGGRALIDVTSNDDERAYELFLRGYGLLGANDRREIETAQDLLERAVGRNPRFARAIAARGYTRWRQYFAGWATNAHALKNALRDVDAALDADPDSVFAHLTFIRTCWDLGWHEQALQAGKSIYEKNPESLDATVAYARALNNAGLAQFALPLVDAVLAVDLTNPAALKLRVWCHLMVGDHTYVLKAARGYLAKHPTDANTRWAVALACQNVPGGGDQAIRIARDALDGDPADVTLWVLLGYLHRLNGDEAFARDAWSCGLERLQAETPDASNWRRKAWVANAQAAVGDSESALRAVHELSEADPENGYLRYRLGHVLAEIGRTGEAVRMLESAVSHGFLSVQLLRQEEVLGLSRLRSLDGYAVVVQRLEASVEQCRRTYAAHLPAAIRTNETVTRDVETVR